MKSKIYISYKEGILDPQGQTVQNALKNMGLKNIKSVRIGKFIEVDFENINNKEAEALTVESCEKLLANPNTEIYQFEIEENG